MAAMSNMTFQQIKLGTSVYPPPPEQGGYLEIILRYEFIGWLPEPDQKMTRLRVRFLV